MMGSADTRGTRKAGVGCDGDKEKKSRRNMLSKVILSWSDTQQANYGCSKATMATACQQ